MTLFFNKKFIVTQIVILSAVILYFVLLKTLMISCPIKELIGHPCPTCGTTRSLISLAKLDFDGYLYYHPGGLIVLISVLMVIYKDLIVKKINQKYFNIILIFNAAIIIIIYILRIINKSIYF